MRLDRVPRRGKRSARLLRRAGRVEGLRILLLTSAIAGSMGGLLYAGVKAERSEAIEPQTLARETERLGEPSELAVASAIEPAELPTGLDLTFHPDLSVPIDLDGDVELFPVPEDIELAGGARIGAFVFDPEAFVTIDDEDLDEGELDDGEIASPRRRTPRAPTRPPGPRLHSDPGIHSILTARQMMASGERIQGSCYAYLSEVYARAGQSGWRNRTIVYRQGRTGPYADLDLIRPGDWLYIVTGPNSVHSVMFVRWEDRARGYARTISHPGWFAGPHTGRESSYDVSQTYRIIRPTG